MPITQVDIDDATNLLDELLGNQQEAEAYSKNPEGWLDEHGYSGVNPEAVSQCGAGYGGGAAVASSGGAAAASGVGGVAAALNPVVYNQYYGVDNSITTNIANSGDLDFNQQITQGDGNVVAGDDIDNDGGQIQTGDGIQAGDDVDIDDSNVATGDDNQQAIDESTTVGDVDVDIDDHSIDNSAGATSTDDSTDVDTGDIDIDA